MNPEYLTKKEKLILIAGIRLFLWELYGMKGVFDREEEISDIIKNEFPRPEQKKDSDIDIVLSTSIELYEKLAYKILEEKKNG